MNLLNSTKVSILSIPILLTYISNFLGDFFVIASVNSSKIKYNFDKMFIEVFEKYETYFNDLAFQSVKETNKDISDIVDDNNNIIAIMILKK